MHCSIGEDQQHSRILFYVVSAVVEVGAPVPSIQQYGTVGSEPSHSSIQSCAMQTSLPAQSHIEHTTRLLILTSPFQAFPATSPLKTLQVFS
jgi:hypothetical protein